MLPLCNGLFAATHRSEIRIRDPFVLVDSEVQTYYLYAQMQNREGAVGQGVEVYTSRDLEHWEGPTPVFNTEPDYKDVSMVWAPEVHRYRGRYYLFVTLTYSQELDSPSTSPIPPPQYVRGTHILVADRPTGPFESLGKGSATPADWMSLDGTLYVEDGIPYMVFCHEWAQIHDGSMELVRLSPDLGKPVGTAKRLFLATEAPWVMNMMASLPDARYDGYVTDGPWFYRTRSGKLQMIWSSFGENRYAIGLAESLSGSVKGPWSQRPEPLYPADGGHGMLFLDLEGRLQLVFHAPNSRGDERLVLQRVTERDDSLVLALP
jgi:GH43 family beta-xylosidase